MEYANNKVFGGTVNEGAYILYYTQTLINSNPLIDSIYFGLSSLCNTFL